MSDRYIKKAGAQTSILPTIAEGEVSITRAAESEELIREMRSLKHLLVEVGAEEKRRSQSQALTGDNSTPDDPASNRLAVITRDQLSAYRRAIEEHQRALVCLSCIDSNIDQYASSREYAAKTATALGSIDPQWQARAVTEGHAVQLSLETVAAILTDVLAASEGR